MYQVTSLDNVALQLGRYNVYRDIKSQITKKISVLWAWRMSLVKELQISFLWRSLVIGIKLSWLFLSQFIGPIFGFQLSRLYSLFMSLVRSLKKGWATPWLMHVLCLWGHASSKSATPLALSPKASTNGDLDCSYIHFMNCLLTIF